MHRITSGYFGTASKFRSKNIRMDIHLLLNPEIEKEAIHTTNNFIQPPQLYPLITSFQYYPSQEYRSPSTLNSALSTYSGRSFVQVNPALASSSITSPFEGRMKKRSQLSKEVLDFLKNQFSKNKFPDTEERQRLSNLLNVPAKSIQSMNSIQN